MGYDIQNYPHPLSTALISNPQSIDHFISALTMATQNNCDAFLTPIFADSYIQKSSQSIDLDHCFILSDQYLKKYQLNLITPIINQCIWKQPLPHRKLFLKLFIGYSSYLNLRYIAVKLNSSNYNQILETFTDNQIIKQFKRCVPNLILIVQTSGDGDQQAKQDDRIWKQYIDFRQKMESIKFPLFIQLALQIKANAPINRIINRWKSQKITYTIISANVFTQNAKGFAILPAKHQRFIIQLLVLRSFFCFKLQKIQHKENQHYKNIQEYYKYVLFAFKKFTQNKLTSQKQAINLIDYLQHPLQPYADNLQSVTYQVFENDQRKYDEYQGALQQAFQTFPKNKRIVLYYIGTGRGGILYNVFAAAKKTQRKVFVYAIQKNLYPIQTIKKRVRQNNWENHVKIVHSDIRDYQMPQKPDIFLSQLLGGFGDNQLSPQCLYWAEKNIAKQTICIPTDYISYIKPVSYQYVHRKIQNNMRQIYYTVNFGSYYTNFAPQQVWRFEHPIRKPYLKNQKNTQNNQIKQSSQISQQQAFNRYSKTTFTSKQDMIINGFAGYFTTALYNFCDLSILPQKPTFGMYSWYPIFFCFQDAQFLSKGQQIQIQIWRKYTKQKVWYQWRYKIGEKISIIHNQNGNVIAIEI